MGSLTLALFRIPTGVRAWIEDVVVDASVRGQGVGDALVDAAIAKSEATGAKTVDLTSRPSRGGGQPAVRPEGLRPAHHQRVPVHAGRLTSSRPRRTSAHRPRARAPRRSP